MTKPNLQIGSSIDEFENPVAGVAANALVLTGANFQPGQSIHTSFKLAGDPSITQPEPVYCNGQGSLSATVIITDPAVAAMFPMCISASFNDSGAQWTMGGENLLITVGLA